MMAVDFKTRLRGECNLNSLWLLLYALGIGLFMVGMPKNVDDFWYMWFLSPWYFDQGILYPDGGGNLLTAGIPWRGIYYTWKFHWYNDNIRLCNMVVTFMLLLPKWFSSGLVLVTWMYAIIRGFALAGIDRLRSALVPFALVVLTFLMPWRDRMGSLVFEFNYIVSSGIAVALLSCLYRAVRNDIRRLGFKACLLYGFLPGLLLGWWQEAFSAPFLAGLVLLVLMFRRWRAPVVYSAMAGLVTGICILATSPFMWARFGGVSAERPLSLFQIGVEVVPFLMMAALTAVVMLFSVRSRRLLRSDLFIFFVVSAAATVALTMFAHEAMRTLTWSVLSSVLAMMMVIREAWPRFWDRYNAVNASVGGVIMIFCTIHLALVDVYSFRFRSIQKQALVDLVEGGRKSAFANGFLLSDLPVITGCLPDYKFFVNSLMYLDLFYNDKSFSRKYLTPEQLRYVTPTSGRVVDAERGIREIDGLFFMPYEESGWLLEYEEMDFGSGYIPYGLYRSEFYSDADGRRYLWLYSWPSFYKTHFGELKGVRFR